MPKIIITSNPYAKQIKYKQWDNINNKERDINQQNYPTSKLISDEFTTCFFPFKANQILDVIIEEFSDGSIDLVFAGTEDEYEVLKSICDSDKYKSTITLTRSKDTLENARDILPDIVDIFQDVNPLISQSVKDRSKIATELAKFTEASNESIPVCVIGNVSAGKSSFINSIIGHEILPSGDEPVTARIYKISPSHYDDRGKIRFTYDGHDVQVKFRGDNQRIDSDLKDHPLINKIEEVIRPLDTVDLIRSLNRTLRTINNFDNEELDDNVSNLIEIEVPFNSSLFGRGKQDFVIFDTPGSNSVSNSKHLTILKQAMENMSNGLPIFVSEFNSLDSMDNEKLYRDIESLEELDNRFTMIVVNKSDKANLPLDGFTPADEEKILSMAIPKNLYSGGIFFVSSVIGLGAKTKGEFDNEFYEEVFEDTVPRFKDPSHKRYKSLYKYNIMPEHLKKEMIEESEECENLLLANSGIYCIEQEINDFAAVYSAYNKCIQSELFLNKVFEVAKAENEAAAKERENSKLSREQMLDKDKQALVEDLRKTSSNLKKKYVEDYKAIMDPTYKGLAFEIGPDKLKAKEIQLKEKYIEIGANQGALEEKDTSSSALFDSIVLGKKKPSVKKVTVNYAIWKDKLSKQKDVEKAARSKAIDELFGDLREEYQKSNDIIHSELLSTSKSYWADKTEAVKKTLVSLVTGSSVLTDVRKKELEELILNYETMKFSEDNLGRLNKDKFEIKLFSLFAFDPLNLNRHKLARVYNSEIKRSKDNNYRNIYVSHVDAYKAWIESLEEMLLNNIVEINPALSAQTEIIKEETAKIQELDSRQRKLNQYVEQIHKMMEWREDVEA